MNASFYFAAALLTGLIMLPQDHIEPLTPVPTPPALKSSTPKQQLPVLNSATPQRPAFVENNRIKADVEAIMEIREQLGGGVIEQLGENFSTSMTPNQPASSKQSTRKLNKAFQEQLAMQLSQPSQPPKSSPPLTDDPRSTRQAPANQNFRTPIRSRSTHRNPEQRQQIREAARMLEEAAAILEEANEFRHADSIRGSAAQLWRTAR